MTLEERRIAANITQAELAKKMDVQQSTVSRWESGKTKPPKKHRKKLAKLYKCKEEELIQ